MGVAVNEAGCYCLAARHDLAGRTRAAQITDGHNAIPRNPNITTPAGSAGTINDGRIADDQIAAESHGNILSKSFHAW
jgi:hypothetical protein